MAVQSPVWAMTPRSLSGLSENITLNGIKITGLKTDPGQAESWVKAIHRDEFISVEILLPELEGFPRLSGQMAWVDTGGSSSPGVLSDSLNVSVGIVFSILKEKEVRALRALVAKLSEIEGEE
jgi:hypothetical protein